MVFSLCPLAADMLLLLLAGCFHQSFTAVTTVMVQQSGEAKLLCSSTTGDVSWRRFSKTGGQVTLFTTKNGPEHKENSRYSSPSDNTLVIKNVQVSDSGMYFCNSNMVYLNVSTDPNAGAPRPESDNGGLDSGPDSETLQPSDLWKIPVGVVIGATLVLLPVVTLRLYSKRRAKRNARAQKPCGPVLSEVIYEEIEDGNEQLRRESEVENLRSAWLNVTETQNTSTMPNHTDLYNVINKMKTTCVYSLVQHPVQMTNVS